jgi:phosphatidylserine synthase
MAKDLFIIRLNPACWLTLTGLAIALASFFLLLDQEPIVAGSSFTSSDGPSPRFFLAVSLMYLGMLADAFDGLLARRFGWEGEFGRYLDGFADVFLYLIVPNMALWRLGFQGPAAGAVIVLMVSAGVLRLSKFNMIGNIKVDGSSKYLGMPVFWSQLLFLPLYLLFAFAPDRVFPVAAGAVWLAMSFAFIHNRPFFKPRNPWIMAGVLLSLSGAAAGLFFAGIHP